MDKKSNMASITKPWMKYYDEKHHDVTVPKRSMYRMLTDYCEENQKQNETALYFYGRKISFGTLFSKIEEYAAAFINCGVKQGDYVSFLTVSLPETIYSIYALNKIGAVCNFIDVRTDATHVCEYIKKAKSKVLITLDQAFEKVGNKLDELGLDLVICQTPKDNFPVYLRFLYSFRQPNYHIPFDGKRVISNLDFARRANGAHVDDVEYKPGMPAVVVRTGGTTGLSKGAVLTNENMNAIVVNFRVSCMDKLPRTSSLLNFLPIGVSYGIAVGMHMPLCLGCEDILIPNFNPDHFDRLIKRYKPNHIIGVPTFYQKLVVSPLLKNEDLSFVYTMAAGGDTANDALEDKLEEFRLAHNIPYPIAQGYGMSEVSSAVSFGFQNIHKKGSAGIPSILTTIAAFKPGTDEELPIGTQGELCITGATVMKCYLDEPEETNEIKRLHPDGQVWIHTGDIGYIDEDGFVYIVGRIKRSIIRFDGHKVYPLQIERVVMKHPMVENCVVIGIKDRQHEQGDLPLVVAQLNDGSLGNEELRKELLALCQKEVELRSQPADVVFVESIPTTKLVKNDYRVLEDKFKDYDYLNRQ